MKAEEGAIRGWRKSSRSGGGNGQCVEVGAGNGVIAVRDTKDRDGGSVRFDRDDWARFTAAL